MTPPLLQLYIVFFGLGGAAGEPLAGDAGQLPRRGAGALALCRRDQRGAARGGARRSSRREQPGLPARRLLPAAIERCYEGLVATLGQHRQGGGARRAPSRCRRSSRPSNTILGEGADAATHDEPARWSSTSCSCSRCSALFRAGTVGRWRAGHERDARGALGLDAVPRRRLRRQPRDRGAGDAVRHRARRGARRAARPAGPAAAGGRGAGDQRLPQRAELRADVLRRLRAAGRDRAGGGRGRGAALAEGGAGADHPGDRLRLGPVPAPTAASASAGARRAPAPPSSPRGSSTSSSC